MFASIAPGTISEVTRARYFTLPRGVTTQTQSPSSIPRAAASSAFSVTSGTGAFRFRPGTP